MTRIALLLVLLSSVVFGQTYVRPSKGVPFTPFTGAGLDGGVALGPAVAGLTFIQGVGPYDWSAFEAVLVRVYTDGVGNNSAGTQACVNLQMQYTIGGIGSYLRFRLQKSGVLGWYLQALDAPTLLGPFALIQTTNGTVRLEDYAGCSLRVMLTPLPFTPSDVVSATNIISDGGTTITIASMAPYQCTNAIQSVQVMDGGAQAMGSQHPTAYTVVCNSRESALGDVRCRADGTNPTMAVGSVGTVLGIGDCCPYTGQIPVCIGGANYVSVYECGL